MGATLKKFGSYAPRVLRRSPQAVIKNADMSEDMQQDAIDCASQAMEKFNIERDLASC